MMHILRALFLVSLCAGMVCAGSHNVQVSMVYQEGGSSAPSLQFDIARLTGDSRELNSWTLGNSFTISTSFTLDSVKLWVENTGNPSGTIVCRVDDDTDMSSEYIEQFSASYGGGGNEYAVIQASGTTTMTGTMYIACNSTATINISVEDSNPYSGGTYRYASYPSFGPLSEITGRDVSMQVWGH